MEKIITAERAFHLVFSVKSSTFRISKRRLKNTESRKSLNEQNSALSRIIFPKLE